MLLDALLRQVIDAQVKAGCEVFKLEQDSVVKVYEDGMVYFGDFRLPRIRHVLYVLLHTDALRALWPQKYDAAGPMILEAWNSGSGCNISAALETAVSLLPGNCISVPVSYD